MRRTMMLFAAALPLFILACGDDDDDDGPGTPIETVKFASLTGPEETPATTSAATGRGVLIVNETTGAARGFVAASGLVMGPGRSPAQRSMRATFGRPSSSSRSRGGAVTTSVLSATMA